MYWCIHVMMVNINDNDEEIDGDENESSDDE